MNSDNSTKPSELVQRIRDRLNALGLDSPRVVVSVADEAHWEKSKRGDEVLVRWACWTIESEGREMGDPEFEVLSHTITREILGKELPKLLPGVNVVVDDNIDV